MENSLRWILCSGVIWRTSGSQPRSLKQLALRGKVLRANSTNSFLNRFSFPVWSTIIFTYFQWQVWAADDYEIFKRMMIQKNIDLQMEALELLQQRSSLSPSYIFFFLKIHSPCWNPGMESFLSPSSLQRSLLTLQWKGRTRWCRRWQGLCKIKSVSFSTATYVDSTRIQSTKFKDIEPFLRIMQ